MKFKKDQKVVVDANFGDYHYLLDGEVLNVGEYNDISKDYNTYEVRIGNDDIWVDRSSVFKNESHFLQNKIDSYKFYISEYKDYVASYEKRLKKVGKS